MVNKTDCKWKEVLDNTAYILTRFYSSKKTTDF